VQVTENLQNIEPEEVQEVRLQATYDKWLQVGGVWSAAAQK